MRILSTEEMNAIALLRQLPEGDREVQQIQVKGAIVLGDIPPVMNQVIYSSS